MRKKPTKKTEEENIKICYYNTAVVMEELVFKIF